MTFPAETKQPQDSKNRMALIISATISEAGPFFGYMSLCAAHRAMLQGKHSDLVSTPGSKDRVLYEPDYYMMKARCISEMNRKMQDPALALTDSAFDIVISLTSSAVGFITFFIWDILSLFMLVFPVWLRWPFFSKFCLC